MPFAAPWMDIDGVILSEVVKCQTKYHMISFICVTYKRVALKKGVQMNLLRTQKELSMWKTNLLLPGARGKEQIGRLVLMLHTTVYKIDN